MKSLDWFRQEFPKAHIEGINAGIGGTGCELGAYRLAHDVLCHKPDLLFIEFAVNDNADPSEQIVRTMEGIVRQAWQAEPELDICFVYTIEQSYLSDLQQCLRPRTVQVHEGVGQPGPHKLGEPLDPDNYQNAHMLPVDPAWLSPGWRRCC